MQSKVLKKSIFFFFNFFAKTDVLLGIGIYTRHPQISFLYIVITSQQIFEKMGYTCKSTHNTALLRN